MQLATTLIGLILNVTPLTSSGLWILPNDQTTFSVGVYSPISILLFHIIFLIKLPTLFPVLTSANDLLPMWSRQQRQSDYKFSSLYPPIFPCAHSLIILPVIRHQQFVFLFRMLPSQLTLWVYGTLRYKGRSPRWKLQINLPFVTITSIK